MRTWYAVTFCLLLMTMRTLTGVQQSDIVANVTFEDFKVSFYLY